MVHAVICAIIWAVTILLIPFKRIWQLRYAVMISIVWMIFVDNLAARLDYYSYEDIMIPVGRASLLQLLGVSGIGILMINWLREGAGTKLLSILTVASAFSVVQFLYLQYGAFRYERFDMTVCFIFNIAALSVYLWMTLTVVEGTLYIGEKTRGLMFSPHVR